MGRPEEEGLTNLSMRSHDNDASHEDLRGWPIHTNEHEPSRCPTYRSRERKQSDRCGHTDNRQGPHPLHSSPDTLHSPTNKETTPSRVLLRVRQGVAGVLRRHTLPGKFQRSRQRATMGERKKTQNLPFNQGNPKFTGQTETAFSIWPIRTSTVGVHFSRG